jgi:hypothetical protein
MRIRLIVLALAWSIVAATSLGSSAAQASTSCRALSAPSGLGMTLLALHREYMRHCPDTHNPKITGPVGPVHLGRCNGKEYAIASFDARYNGFYFGTEDQPERFVKPHHGDWRDLGNTGGDPCGSMPTVLLVDWRIVRHCAG